jgi:hypothetical protein
MTAIWLRADIQKPELWLFSESEGGTGRRLTDLENRPAPIALKCSTANKRKLLDAECYAVNALRIDSPIPLVDPHIHTLPV